MNVPLTKLGKLGDGALWGNSAFSFKYIVFKVSQIEIIKI